MHTESGLYNKLISYKNLSLAIDKTIEKRKSKWISNHDIFLCRTKKKEIIYKIQKSLMTDEYKYLLSQYTETHIYDGISKKERDIVCPKILYAQILHHAIEQVLEPLIRRGMYKWSCANIKGRGIHYAKKHIEDFIRKHPHQCKYYLKIDIHHFYPCINHEKLYISTSKYIKDNKFNKIYKSLIQCYHSIEGKDNGLAIGFFTSQWIANWYLQDLDHYVCEQIDNVYGYTRYADDIILFSPSKKSIHKAKIMIESFLNSKNLTINNKWIIQRFDYTNKKDERHGRFLDFVGYRFYRDKTTLRNSTYSRVIRKFNKQSNDNNINWYNSCQTNSYIAKMKSCNLYKKLIEYMNKLDISLMKTMISGYSKIKSIERTRHETEMVRFLQFE